MPTQPYLIDGVRVPGVTTILSRFKEAGGLIHWAWKLGMEGKDYRQVRDTAADAGTIAHDMMECWVRGRAFESSKYEADLVAMAQPAFNAFLSWAQQSKFCIAESEVPLISKVHRFGGTRDAILIDGKRSLGDWKTSNSIYPEYLCQLGAYQILDEENGGKIEGGFHLQRFSLEQKSAVPSLEKLGLRFTELNHQPGKFMQFGIVVAHDFPLRGAFHTIPATSQAVRQSSR